MSTQSQAGEDTKKTRQVILQDNSKIDIPECFNILHNGKDVDWTRDTYVHVFFPQGHSMTGPTCSFNWIWYGDKPNSTEIVAYYTIGYLYETVNSFNLLDEPQLPEVEKEGNKKKTDKLQELHGFIKDTLQLSKVEKEENKKKLEQFGGSLKSTMDDFLPHTTGMELFYDEELKEKDLVFKYLEVMTSELSSFNNDSKDSLKEALKYFDMIGAEERHEDPQTQIINDYSYLCAQNLFKFITTTLKD